MRQRADLFDTNISANKIAFLRARTTLKENTLTAPKIWI